MEPYENPEKEGQKTIWIIGGVILLIMVVAVVYGVTQKTLKKNASSDLGTTPVNQVRGAESYTETPVAVTGLDVVNLETYPQKVQAHVTANLANDCSTGNAVVAASGNTFTVTITGRQPKDAVCNETPTVYETVLDIPVTDLSMGTYNVTSGGITKSFTLKKTSASTYSSDK